MDRQTLDPRPARRPLARATPTRWVRVAFWFLRAYIVVMLVVVVVGFVRGSL